MLVKGEPQTTVIPVATSGGKDGLVAGKGVQVIDAAGSALKALPVFMASDVVVKVGNGVQVKVGRCLECLFFCQTVAGILVKTGGKGNRR